MTYYLENKDDVLRELKTCESGLEQDVAGKRLAENGRNELVKPKKKSMFRRFAEQLANPMVLILLAAAAVSVFLMERAEPGIMERPPRGTKEGIFSGELGFDVVYQGILISLLTLVIH